MQYACVAMAVDGKDNMTATSATAPPVSVACLHLALCWCSWCRECRTVYRQYAAGSASETPPEQSQELSKGSCKQPRPKTVPSTPKHDTVLDARLCTRLTASAHGACSIHSIIHTKLYVSNTDTIATIVRQLAVCKSHHAACDTVVACIASMSSWQWLAVP